MNTHTINRQIIDLKVRSQQNAFRIQQQAREAWELDVLPLLNELLDELAGPDEVLRIEKLELDLGAIKAEKMGVEMKERLREVLREELMKYRNEVPVTANHATVFRNKNASEKTKNESRRMSLLHSHRELLEYFFETGFLPWWAGDEQEAPDIEQLVIELFEKEPVSTFQWLQEIAAKTPAAVKRMLLQLSPSVQKRMLRVPGNPVPAYLEKFAVTITRLLTSTGWTAPIAEEAQQIVFAASLLSRKTESIAGSLEIESVSVFIRQLAVQLQTPVLLMERRIYEGMLSFAAKAKKEELKKESALIRHFVEWEKAEPEIAATISGDTSLTLASLVNDEKSDIGEEADRREQLLEQFFFALDIRRQMRADKTRTKTGSRRSVAAAEENTETGKQASSITSELPAVKKAGRKKRSKTEEIVNDSVSGNNTETATDLPAKAKKEPEAEEIIQPKKKKAEVLTYTEPKKKKTTVKEEIKSAAPGKAITQEEELKVQPAKRKEEETTEFLFADPLAETDTEAVTAESKTSDEADDSPFEENRIPAGMTRYAGLALFGPFIAGLFSELKLVSDDKFISDEARNRAVFLLHYLATGKTKAPEYALTLHKLLCGMKITDPVPRKMMLTAAEKKEAMLFLDDIAGQWPTLQGTSGEAMRNTFMRRNGIIENKENAWLLRIERGPMDIMLDTLPWGISIIKMPWMQQLLYVEW